MSSLKFYLLHTEVKSKWYNHIVQQLAEKSIYFYESSSIKETLQLYKGDENNSFIFIDIFSTFSSFELQELRGTKSYCVIQCKFELQKTKERINGQKIKEICIKGQSILKCISIFSFISNYDPIIEIKSIASNHINARLASSEAYVHFEIVEPSIFQGYRYCVDTDSESLCFMIFNDNPIVKQVTEEINQFIHDKLNLRENIQENEYFEKLIYLKKMGELCQEAMENKNSQQLKPIFITKQIEQQHKEKYVMLKQEQASETVSIKPTIVDSCIADSKIVPPIQIVNIDTKFDQLFGQKIQFCTTGTAAINQEALFDPLKKFKNTYFSSFYTSNESKGRVIYNQNKSEGVHYYPNIQELVNHFDGVAYVPSLPGKRKEQEMLSFIQAEHSKNYVLAEKPAFANYECAQKFLQRSKQIMQQNQKSEQQKVDRIFFGWHYIHHPAIQDVVKRTQDGEFGLIKKIQARFVRPKPFSSNGRIFDPNQGGCGLDRFCYPLHLALTLSKCQVKSSQASSEVQSQTSYLNDKQQFQVISSTHLNYNEIYDQNNPVFDQIEGRLESKLILNSSINVELYSSMETNETFYSEALIIFENETQIKLTWFIHPHVQFKDFKLYCASIKYPNKKSFQPLSHMTSFDKNLTSYDYQIQYMVKLKSGLIDYDTSQDRFNLCTESNAYLHLVLDKIFTSSGLKVKQGL
ncbi:hypothetical protein ABPG72_015409 [Tetrahymena utriculariae]